MVDLKNLYYLKNWGYLPKIQIYFAKKKSRFILIKSNTLISQELPSKTILFIDVKINIYIFFKENKNYKKFKNIFTKKNNYYKKLNLTGIGFKYKNNSNKTQILSLGYSHNIFCYFPPEIFFKKNTDNSTTYWSNNKQKINETIKKIMLLKDAKGNLIDKNY